MTDDNADTTAEPTADSAAGKRAAADPDAPRETSKPGPSKSSASEPSPAPAADKSPPRIAPGPKSSTHVGGKPQAPAAPPRRAGTFFAILLALAALAGSGFAIYRLENERRLLDELRDEVRGEIVQSREQNEVDLTELRSSFDEFAQRQAAEQRELTQQLDELLDLPREVATVRAGLGDVRTSLAELRSRSELPVQTWSRAEVRVLLDMAARRLTLERDVATALDALTTADGLLADLDDPAFEPVRQQIARDRRALEAVPLPDRTALAERLAEAESNVGTLPLAGIVLDAANGTSQAGLPSGGLERAWALVRNAFSNLIAVRRIGDADAIVNTDLAALRRQHLELLLASARTALLRSDADAFEMAVARAQDWIDRYFLTDDPRVAALRDELDALGQIDVVPPLPDIASSVRAFDAVPAPTGARP